jgi:hypothetical protein
MIVMATTTAMLWTATATGVQAAGHKSDPSCSVSPSAVTVGQSYTVTAVGLPTNTPLNLFITDLAGTNAVPLGSSATGSYSLKESSPVAGMTTYKFTGVVKSNMTVYATCSVSVS